MLGEIMARKDDPRDDIISLLWQTEIDGKPMTVELMEDYCVLLFIAGLGTVINGMGFAIRHLALHPELQDQLRAQPELIVEAAEEMLRRYSFTIPMRRVAHETTLAGWKMMPGEWLALYYPGADLDPREFAVPEAFDLERENKVHLAFGAGPHRCLGSHLARMELRVALEEWHRRIPEYRIADGAELDALILRGQETAAPQAIVERLIGGIAGALRDHDDEGGQIAILAAETIGEPRPHARPARELSARLKEGDRGIVVDRLGVHRLDEAQPVGDSGRVGEELADPRAAFAVTGERVLARGDRKTGLGRRHSGEPLAAANRIGELGPAEIGQARLPVEEVHLRRCARLEEVDDPFGLGGEVRETGKASRVVRGILVLGERLRIEQRRQSERSKSQPGAAEQGAAGEKTVRCVQGNPPHSFVIVSSRFKITPASVV
jgi:hypothetical protein